LLLLFLIFLQRPDDKLHLIFCDVGQGDAILVKHKNTQILIDGGPDGSVLGCLSSQMPFWDRTIELILLTHSDSDHYRGLVEVVDRYQVEKIGLNPFGKKGDPDFKELIKKLSEKKVYSFFPRRGDKIRSGLIVFDILWPSDSKLKEIDSLVEESEELGSFWLIDPEWVDDNEFSITTRLSFGRFDALLTGDLPVSVSQTLAWRHQLPSVEVLKAPHHGSAKDNPDELYRVTKPKLVVFSVGKNNFGHPSKDLIEKLKNQGVKTERTDYKREVKIISDGEAWWVE